MNTSYGDVLRLNEEAIQLMLEKKYNASAYIFGQALVRLVEDMKNNSCAAAVLEDVNDEVVPMPMIYPLDIQTTTTTTTNENDTSSSSSSSSLDERKDDYDTYKMCKKALLITTTTTTTTTTTVVVISKAHCHEILIRALYYNIGLSLHLYAAFSMNCGCMKNHQIYLHQALAAYDMGLSMTTTTTTTSGMDHNNNDNNNNNKMMPIDQRKDEIMIKNYYHNCTCLQMLELLLQNNIGHIHYRNWRNSEMKPCLKAMKVIIQQQQQQQQKHPGRGRGSPSIPLLNLFWGNILYNETANTLASAA